MCKDDEAFEQFQKILKSSDSQQQHNIQQSTQKPEFPRDYQTPQLYSVYERLYSLTTAKNQKHQKDASSVHKTARQNVACQRLYREAQDRTKRTQAK